MSKTTGIRLTDAAIRAAEPRAKNWRLYDSLGLILEVHPSGGKYWRLKYRVGGREKRLSLGVFPDVNANEARERRNQAREMLAAGVDPSELRKKERVAQRAEQTRTESAIRFRLDKDGDLSFQLGKRCVRLIGSETAELRAFLEATRAVLLRH
ncbi:Arm DNA-binding domain-containing protein [Burkholderia sp. 8Y]|uniref:Arm DNA-binding domain-containing protein n=1 Tax=Burkholderia sp. 8Y TaxID=2653133 RepID=UPI002E2C7ADC|nr:Arm DNA-binding domain-containing protein [Burkholderia sp. 8Y]